MESPKDDQYNEFLHKIQQPKMKEVWDNKQDKIWEKMEKFINNGNILLLWKK